MEKSQDLSTTNLSITNYEQSAEKIAVKESDLKIEANNFRSEENLIPFKKAKKK